MTVFDVHAEEFQRLVPLDCRGPDGLVDRFVYRLDSETKRGERFVPLTEPFFLVLADQPIEEFDCTGYEVTDRDGNVVFRC